MGAANYRSLRGDEEIMASCLPDALAVAGGTRALSPRSRQWLGSHRYGDVGGFGVGAHTDWQVLGTVDYTLDPSWNLHLRYRSLNFNIAGSKGRLGFNVHMRIAGTFRF
jgi:hypothetical protein